MAGFSCTWSNLSSLRTTSILQIGYIGMATIPTISFGITILNEIFPDGEKLSLPWTLLLAFFGSLFLALGHFLNEILCPQLIKKNPTPEFYRSSISEHIKDQSRMLANEMRKEKRSLDHELHDKFPALSLQAVDEITLTISKKLKEIDEDSSEAPSAFRDYESHWDKEDKSLPLGRRLIATFYAISSAILAILIVTYSFRVLEASIPL